MCLMINFFHLGQEQRFVVCVSQELQEIRVYGLGRSLKKTDSPLEHGKGWPRGVQPFGLSEPHWKKTCLGPHMNYTNTKEN